MFRVTMIYIYIYINYLFCIVIYSFPCPFMYNYVYIYKLVPMIWNIYLLFVLSFVCFHVDHDTTNASLYLCLFPHIHAPVYVLKCWYSCCIFFITFRTQYLCNLRKYNALLFLNFVLHIPFCISSCVCFCALLLFLPHACLIDFVYIFIYLFLLFLFLFVNFIFFYFPFSVSF